MSAAFKHQRDGADEEALPGWGVATTFMNTSEPDLLSQYKRVTDLAIAYFSVSPWTPAFAASFVCGIEPVMGCRSIPKRAMQVRRASARATAQQLDRAKSLLQDWRADHSDEDDPTVRPPSKVEPLEFMEWCEWYQSNGVDKPDLLAHLLGLINTAKPYEPHRLSRRPVGLSQTGVI